MFFIATYFTGPVVKSEPGLLEPTDDQSFAAPLLTPESFLPGSVDVKMENN